MKILLRLQNAEEDHKSNDMNTKDMNTMMDINKLNEIQKMVSTIAHEIDNIKKLLESQNLIINQTGQISEKILNLLSNMNENFKLPNIETKIADYCLIVNNFIARADTYFENYLNVQNLIVIINEQGEKIDKILVFIENHKYNQGCKNPTSPTGNGDINPSGPQKPTPSDERGDTTPPIQSKCSIKPNILYSVSSQEYSVSEF